MRTYVITGSASGIGAATAARLTAAGHRVIGVDLRGSDIEADLSTPLGRNAMVDGVRAAAGDRLDAVIACAGVAGGDTLPVAVNYFGAVATLDGLRPLLAAGDEPRAAVVASSSLFLDVQTEVVDACLGGDEEAALAAARAAGWTYAASKRAIARWVRRMAPTPEWAGAGIALNAVAPGVVQTPMTADLLADPGGRELVDQSVPMPYGGYGNPEAIAAVLDFFTAPTNTMITGQVLFADGGADVVLNGDDIW